MIVVTDANLDASARTRAAEIEQRWKGTEDQVVASMAAIDRADLSLANDTGEIDQRRARLEQHDLDLEAVIGADDSLWLTFLSRGLTAAGAVGRVVFADTTPMEPSATGVLVARRLLLTNNHVIPDTDTGAEMGVQFGYEYADDGAEREPTLYRLDPAAGFITDVERDFTVVAVSDVDGAPAGGRFGVVRLIAQQGKVLKAERLNVIHHPGGDRKRISFRENRMVAQDDLWIRYTSDTRPGSSGAPVFNDQWEMVALHHGAVPCGSTAAGSGDGTGDPGCMANEGIRVSRILQWLATTDDPQGAAILHGILSEGAAS